MVININPMFNIYSEHIQLWQKAGSEFRNLHLKWTFISLPNRLPQNSEISPGAYIFQRPFLRGLYSEGLIYGEKVAFQNRLGLFYFIFEGNFQVQAPVGLMFRGEI